MVKSGSADAQVCACCNRLRASVRVKISLVLSCPVLSCPDSLGFHRISLSVKNFNLVVRLQIQQISWHIPW